MRASQSSANLNHELFQFTAIEAHMKSRRLKNYLRTHRKRLALSQDDVGFLLGVSSGTKACRYERHARIPNLETALAFEAIFQRPVRELFGGIYQKAEQDVIERAEFLASRSKDTKATKRLEHRRAALKAISVERNYQN